MRGSGQAPRAIGPEELQRTQSSATASASDVAPPARTAASHSPQPAASSHTYGRSPGTRRSIFERYGGFAKINRVVTTFYDKVLDSPVVAPYFAHTDMRQLIDHQTRFIATVMGGPASYTDDHLERVHFRHHITDAAFDEVCGLLQEALEDHDFADEDIRVVLDAVAARKHHIVSRS